MSEHLYTLALQRILFNHTNAATVIYDRAGSATAVYENRNSLADILPDSTDNLRRLVSTDWSEHLKWAEKEMEWCREKSIDILTPNDDKYPKRLTTCEDAPIALFFRGTANLNTPHAISIVGTRQSTPYGHDVIHRLLNDLKSKVPDLLVVSGLAYGIDICAHRESLACGLDTVGVLAHGLDTIYPAMHRKTAIEMLSHGGLLTEYASHAHVDRQNFLRRNRIVAGACDACLIIQSKAHGGSLVTARLANDYSRQVFAVPGRIGDDVSEGCNNIIKRQQACMLTSADDIIDALGWITEEKQQEKRAKGIEPQLFPALNAEQKLIADALADADMQINTLCAKTGIAISKLSAMLFDMELNGMIKPLPGGMYHLIL